MAQGVAALTHKAEQGRAQGTPCSSNTTPFTPESRRMVPSGSGFCSAAARSLRTTWPARRAFSARRGLRGARVRLGLPYARVRQP